MPRGRKKKPDELKRLEGNPGKRPLNGNAPVPTGRAVMPSYVVGYAEEVWNQIIESMPPNLYTAVDTVTLAAFCVAAGQYRQATEQLAREGLTSNTVKGDQKPHPALTAQTRALATIATLGARLGLDPSSRVSLTMPKDSKPKSKFTGLIGGHLADKKAGA